MGGGASKEEPPKQQQPQPTKTPPSGSSAASGKSPQPPRSRENGTQRPFNRNNHNGTMMVNDDASPLDSLRIDTITTPEDNHNKKRPMLLRSNTTNLNSTQNLGRTGHNSAFRETALGVNTSSSKSPQVAPLAVNASSPNDKLDPLENTQGAEGGLNRVGSKANSAFASAKVRARVAEREATEKQKQENLERQASNMNGGGLLGGTVTAANMAASAREARHVVNGTAKIKNLCETIQKFRQQMKKHKEVSDSDIAELKRTQDHYAQLKNAFAQQIASIGEHVDVVGKPNRDLLYDVLEGIMMESEVREGSQSLLRACITHLTPLDWQVDFIVGGKGMMKKCVKEGWWQFLDILLSAPSMIIVNAADAEIMIAEDLAMKTAAMSPSPNNNKKNEAEDEDDFLADIDDAGEEVDPFKDVGGEQLQSDDDDDGSLGNSLAGSATARKMKKQMQKAAGSSSPSPSSSPNNKTALVDPQLENYLDPIELLKDCAANERSRIPLLSALCKNWSKLRFLEYARLMLPIWKDAVRSLCSQARSHRGEDRSQRTALLAKILSLSNCIPININEVDTEGGDNQSLISRAIIEGETSVFQTLTRKSVEVDWTVILPDGHSLLTLACQCAQKTVVESLLQHSEIDINYVAPGHGSALEIVQVDGGGNQQILALIEARLKKIEDERSAEELTRIADEQKAHHLELKKKAGARRRKIQEKARTAQPPKWIEENPPTGPPKVDPENDEDWIYGWHRENIKPVILTGPILDIVNTLREHWNLMDSLTGNDSTAGNNRKKKASFLVGSPMSGAAASSVRDDDGIAKIDDAEDENALSDIDSDGENNNKNEETNNNHGQPRRKSFLSTSDPAAAATAGGGSSSKLGSRRASFAAETNIHQVHNSHNKNEGNNSNVGSRRSSFMRKSSFANNNSNPNSRPGSSAVANNKDDDNNKKSSADAKVDFNDDKGTIDITFTARVETVTREEEEPVQVLHIPATKKKVYEEELSPEQEAAIKATSVYTERFEDRDYLLDGENLRLDLIATMLSLGLRIAIEGKDPKEKVYQCVGRLLSESEKSKGSLKLARILMYRVISVDFAPAISGTHKWALHAAMRGDLEALETLLRVDKLWREEHEVVELVMACVRHKEKRFQLVVLLLRHQKQLRFGTYRDHLRPLWEELIETTTNPSKINLNRLTDEEKKLRFELYCRIFNNPRFFPIRHDIEISKGITFFSRACRIGDMEFVKPCILYVVCDINKVFSNKSTALMQAIVGNQLEVVKLLCECQDLDPFVEGPNDATALDLAKQMNRDQEIMDEIIKAMEAWTNEEEEEANNNDKE